MSYLEKKPKQRSKFRVVTGHIYFTTRKYIQWFFSSKKYTKRISEIYYDNVIFTHKTPLYRKLKDVDMYLQKNKVENLRLAISKLNGVIIMPGEYFSYWKLIGRPTSKKGYKEGVILTSNGGFKPGIGGGLCQLSNLLYWMTLHTPLKVTERYRHSHDVFPDSKRTQPFGTGATCYFNFLDLEFKNDSNQPYQLKVTISNDELIGQWLSSEKLNYIYTVYEKEHSITPGFYGGYMRNNLIYRKTYNTVGEEIKDEYIAENHALMMYQPFLENK